MVSGSFQGFDQDYLVDALNRLGGSFAGVTQIPVSVADEEVLRLHATGVRAVRFNLYRGGSESLDNLESLARRVYELAGWHTELYVDSKDLPDLEDRLAVLPQVCIDHLGMSAEGYPALLRLVERGMKVKATGFGRLDGRLGGGPGVARALREVSSANHNALMFGTDLPGTRAPRPFEEADMELIVDTLGEKLAHRVLHDNAAELYLSTRSRGT